MLLGNWLSIVCIVCHLFDAIKVYLPAPFHDAIRGIFPDLIVSLKNNNGKVWSGGASIIGKLVEHGVY